MCPFEDQTDVVHVDEKWFCLMEDGALVCAFPNTDSTLTVPGTARVYSLGPWSAAAAVAGSESED